MVAHSGVLISCSFGACIIHYLLMLEHYSREVHNVVVAKIVHADILCKSEYYTFDQISKLAVSSFVSK